MVSESEGGVKLLDHRWNVDFDLNEIGPGAIVPNDLLEIADGQTNTGCRSAGGCLALGAFESSQDIASSWSA